MTYSSVHFCKYLLLLKEWSRGVTNTDCIVVQSNETSICTLALVLVVLHITLVFHSDNVFLLTYCPNRNHHHPHHPTYLPINRTGREINQENNH